MFICKLIVDFKLFSLILSEKVLWKENMPLLVYIKEPVPTSFSSGKTSFEGVLLRQGIMAEAEGSYSLIGTAHAIVQREEATTG